MSDFEFCSICGALRAGTDHTCSKQVLSAQESAERRSRLVYLGSLGTEEGIQDREYAVYEKAFKAKFALFRGYECMKRSSLRPVYLYEKRGKNIYRYYLGQDEPDMDDVRENDAYDLSRW